MNDIIRILVVDDEPDIRNVLNILLTSHGYLVDEAENGMRAVEMAQETEYDLIIMDIMMPGMSGTDACAQIRRSSRAPVLFLTAKDQDADQREAYGSGGDDYLVKPFSKTSLFLHVEALLRRYRVYRGKGDASTVIDSLEINTERGIVIRLGKDGLYTEYALNRFDPEHPEACAEAVRKSFPAWWERLASLGISVALRDG